MSSVVDICNQALRKVGTQTINSLTEGSAQSILCNELYAPVRDGLLREHPWRFAWARQALATPSSATVPTEWAYVYTLPGDYLAARYVEPVSGGPYRQDSQGYIYTDGLSANRIMAPSFAVAAGQLFTDVDDAVLIYTRRVSDTTVFDPLFVRALAAALALELVMPLTQGADLYRILSSQARAELDKAKAHDGNDGTTRPDHLPDWLAARA